jgi:hypothetical protein
MSDCTIIINEEVDPVNVSINEEIDPITVVIDSGPSIPVLADFLSVFLSNSSKWVETSGEMDTLQNGLTAKWDETSYEMDTLQVNLSANWQDTYEKSKSGIIDGGFC